MKFYQAKCFADFINELPALWKGFLASHADEMDIGNWSSLKQTTPPGPNWLQFSARYDQEVGKISTPVEMEFHIPRLLEGFYFEMYRNGKPPVRFVSDNHFQPVIFGPDGKALDFPLGDDPLDMKFYQFRLLGNQLKKLTVNTWENCLARARSLSDKKPKRIPLAFIEQIMRRKPDREEYEDHLFSVCRKLIYYVSSFRDETNPLAILSQAFRVQRGAILHADAKKRKNPDEPLKRQYKRLPGSAKVPMARDIHASFRNHFCPIETPESKMVGLTLQLALNSEVNEKDGSLSSCQPEKTKAPLMRDAGMFGIGCLQIPFISHNDPPRVMMGAKNLKQAVPPGRPELPWVKSGGEILAGSLLQDSLGFDPLIKSPGEGEIIEVKDERLTLKMYENPDNPLHISLWRKPQGGKPIASYYYPMRKTRDKIRSGDILAVHAGMALLDNDKPALALGKNLLILYLPWFGWNFEDAIVASEGVKTALSAKLIYPLEFPSTPEILEDIECLIRGRFNDLQKLDQLVKKIPYFGSWDSKPILEKEVFIRNDKEWVRLWLLIDQAVDTGDKLMGRYGNKGVISCFLAENELPLIHLPDGNKVKPDLILNPMGIFSRKNLGQLFETHLGLLKAINPDRFETMSNWGFPFKSHENPRMADELIQALGESGAPDGKLKVTFHHEGKTVECQATVGYQYIVRLDHSPAQKLTWRKQLQGCRSPITGQPFQGILQKARKTGIDGGQRIGEMEMWALFAHGLKKNLKEILGERSHEPGFDFKHLPHRSFQAMKDLFKALNLNIRLAEDTSRQTLILESLSEAGKTVSADNNILTEPEKKWRFLSIPNAAFQENGMCPVTHPLTNKPLDILRILPQKYLQGVVLGRTKPSILSRLYLRVEMILRYIENGKIRPSIRLKMKKSGEETLTEARKLDRDDLQKLLEKIFGCRFQPPVKKTEDANTPDFSELVEKIFEEPRPVAFESQRQDLFHALDEIIPGSIFGLKSGDRPSLLKSESKGKGHDWVKEISKGGGPNSAEFQSILGMLSGKFGMIRRHLLGRRVDLSGRCVIVPNPSLLPDQVRLPDSLKNFVNRKLSGKRRKKEKDSDQVAERWVLLNRNPTLHRYNILSAKVKEYSPRMVMELSPLVCGCFGADFDGDTMAFHFPISPEAQQEARDVAAFSSHFFSVASGRMNAHFVQDIRLGLHLIQRMGGSPFAELKQKMADLLKKDWDQIKNLSQTCEEMLRNPDFPEKLIVLQEISRLAFQAASIAGISISLADLLSLKLAPVGFQNRDAKVLQNELKDLAIQIVKKTGLPSVFDILLSGARDPQFSDIRQLAGSLGIIKCLYPPNSDPLIPGLKEPPPVHSCYLKGLSPDEFWAASRGGRAGMVPKKMSTPEAGYFTRLLIESAFPWRVSSIPDCGTPKGIHLSERMARGRNPTSIPGVFRSPVFCKAHEAKAFTICPMCLGENPATGKPFEPGIFIGILSAQSVGERGTQEAMKHFHKGAGAGMTTNPGEKNRDEFSNIPVITRFRRKMFLKPPEPSESPDHSLEDSFVRFLEDLYTLKIYEDYENIRSMHFEVLAKTRLKSNIRKSRSEGNKDDSPDFLFDLISSGLLTGVQFGPAGALGFQDLVFILHLLLQSKTNREPPAFHPKLSLLTSIVPKEERMR